MRDRFVCGIKADNIKHKLLTESKLDFKGAYKIAISMELAEGQVKVMGSESSHVNKIYQKSHNYPKKANHSQNTSRSQGSSKSRPDKGSQTKCKRCCRMHFDVNKCPAINWKCFSCNQMGHTGKSQMCKNNRVNEVDEDEEDVGCGSQSDEDFELGLLTEECSIRTLKVNQTGILKVKVCIDEQSVEMEVDSGAVRSVMHELDWKQLFNNLALAPVNFKLRVLTGEKAKILGQVYVHVKYLGKVYYLPLVILRSDIKFIPLLGRNWLDILNNKWRVSMLGSHIVSVGNQLPQLGSVSISESNNVKLKMITSLKQKYNSLFQEEPNSFIKNFKAEFKIKENYQPIFHRAYEMPFALKPQVEEELSRMVNSGVLSKVSHSNWASPIVVVPKKNASEIRICVDFKKTLNLAIDSDHCFLPLPSDIFATLSGSEFYCVIDLKGAYQQLQISESSKELFTINTHIGLFRFNRLTYGVSSAPGIFQCIMDAILSGLPKTKCYLDDILVHGSSLNECYQNVENVLNRLKGYNVKVNESKCQLFETSVEFLGHKLDRLGVHPTNEKIECIQKAPSPQNMTQLKSYLGLLNFYGKFIPMLSSKLKPLYDLCRDNQEFIWSTKCEQCFQESKNLLIANNVLTHYDPTEPIYITCDASGYGVGAVLSHKINNIDKPVLFASSTLSENEKKYSNLERESLALIFALKKFHKYIYGRRFTLVTDHQPLQYIFGKNKSIPVTAAARITRWAITLSAYNYDIQYKKGSHISNADGLSRLPLNTRTEISDAIFSFSLSYDLPITFENIAIATKKDINLSKIVDFTLSGWPNTLKDENLKSYFKRKLEFSVENGCLLVGNKVVIPKSLQKEILQLFHEQHIGIVRTKMLIRSYCWWPGINEDVEQFIKSCDVCQATQNFTNDKSVLLPWPTAPNNFYRVHIDFFKSNNATFLILVDDKSGWCEVKLMDRGTNIHETILKLKQIFSVFGLPVELVSDNGPPFGNSYDFTSFCHSNGIRFIRIPPKHPESNGLGEKGVQTIKKGLQRSLFKGGEQVVTIAMMLNKLENFLFVHRNTPNTSTGLSPAECIFKIRPRTRFDLLKPWSKKQKPLQQDVINKIRLYSENDIVYVKNKYNKQWEKGKIVRCMSYSTYLVQIDDNIKLYHINDIRKCQSVREFDKNDSVQEQPPLTEINDFTNLSVERSNVQLPIDHNQDEPKVEEVPRLSRNIQESSTNPVVTHNPVSHGTPATQSTTRSGRIVKPPQKLDL
ncbi:uncharacterized protein K02A2.6-like [Photinus pyralis]|uniref:uncharacterized protein K02A2.6-like n=1 Tax=Photinus pyralis TaxID=7054 RepID=UPI00126724EB|nr:uncharacterized protein K02A2.6-like [Photinus pyralis]